ncbi:MAG TPA: tetratricopeptide repeat protein [Verrucomicrobiae bacterium]|jgi:tetratricopeptide (TPR) repeat protein|nr:tetratricopeptide repeat protein [Verrucomicrobiae bacterium]
MKRIAIVIAVAVGISGWSWAQSNQKPAQSSTPATGQGQAAAPAGKRPPQAKTQPEFEAYKAAIAATDAAALEKAADDFAAKFPDSELRVVLYKAAMQKYQQANNGDKMMEMARKALTYDPDDPEALLGVAQVVVEQTHDTDLDKDQKVAEARKDSERALVTIDTDVPTSGYPPAELEAFKNFLRSEAYLILGTLSFKSNQWADAETNLRKSIDVFPQQPDPVAVFRLAVALDEQNKYPEAMKYANQAVDMTKDRPDSGVGKAARDEKDRLEKLTGTAAPAAAPAKQ